VKPEREIERGRELPASAIPIAEALRDVRLARGGAGPSPAGHVSAAVAAAVRAAVDWLTADGFDTRPPRLASHYGALELRFDAVAHSGLEAAADVLESADSNLGPAEAGSGWLLRAPLLAERDTYLMIDQGNLSLAVPWHAVVRVRLLPAETIDATARRHSYALLEPYAKSVPVHDERLAVLIGLGLRRGLLIADRLIWRMPAERVTPSEPPPAAGLTRFVRTEEGDGFWVVDPRQALHGVGPMRLPAPTEPPRREPPAKEEPKPPAPETRRILVLRPEDVEPFGEEESEPVTTAEPEMETVSELGAADLIEDLAPMAEPEIETTSEPEAAAIIEDVAPEPEMETASEPEAALVIEDVAPMAEPADEPAHAMTEEPAHAMTMEPEFVQAMEPEPAQTPEAATSLRVEPAPPPVAAPAPSIAPAAEAPPVPVAASAAEAMPARSALVAEDSITARYFLTRLLEQRGFAVRGVSSAAEVARATDRFGVVFADVELPDQRGAAYLAPLVERMREAGASVVALVRDAADSEAARAAGVVHVLRKPFEADALDRLLVRLGLSERAR